MYVEELFKGVIVVTSACCQPVLQSSTGQWEVHFVLNSTAVHWNWVTAHMYVQQTPKCLFAVTQAFCQPVLQSNSGQWGMHFVLTSAVVHWWWDTAHIYVEQSPKGLFAVTEACCQPVLQSSSGQWGKHFALNIAAVQWWWETATQGSEEYKVVQTSAANLQSNSGQGGTQFALTNAAVQWVMRHWTPVRWRIVQRCNCSDTSMPSACFAEQHRAVRSAFCPEQYCSGLNLGTAHLYVEQIPKGLFAVTEICWQPVLQSNSG